jgi:predicted TIM-barrel fold metal-dependent hydrolase
MGADRVIFGSDYPWYDPMLAKEVIDKARLSRAERRLVMDTNARELLN